MNIFKLFFFSYFISSSLLSTYQKINLDGLTLHSKNQITPQKPLIKHRQHHLIEFTTPPKDEKQHADWVNAIEKALDQTGKKLIEKGLIMPLHRYVKKEHQSLLEKIEQKTQDIFYDVFFQTHTFAYPQKKNYPFFTRRNEQFGSMGIYAPDGVSPDLFLEILRNELQKQGVEVTVIPDQPMYIDKAFPVESFSHISFSYPALQAFKSGELKKKYEALLTKNSIQLQSNYEKKIKETLKIFDDFEKQLFWHQTIPTTGIRCYQESEEINPIGQKKSEKVLWKANYPFIPHQFPLWQMAPKLGKGVKVAIIDTGIAAFDIKKTSESIPDLQKNEDLSMEGNFTQYNYNLVSAYNLNPTNDLIMLVWGHLDPLTFKNEYIKQTELETIFVSLVYDYFKDKNLFEKNIDTFLKQHGASHITNNERTELSKVGKKIITNLKKTIKKLHPVELIDPKTQKIIGPGILEFMPTAPILKQNKKTLQIGHGSHVAGIIAGRLQHDDIEKTHYQPETDEGICGIAPNAEIIMLKAFDDDGTTYNSTLIASLIQSLQHNAHVVNMSLKASDKLNTASDFSTTLHTLINLIPYCIASSGNDGNPEKQNYAGPVESYPARIDGIAFSVGAFAFDADNQTCPVTDFSQYQLAQDKKGKTCGGPLFVAPGFNILSTGLSDAQTSGSTAVVMQGTSMAAPMLSGFTALMLSEFPDTGENAHFTRDQLLTVCYKSGIKMMDTDDWNIKSIFGSLDMRTALFTLHVLRDYKKRKNINEILSPHMFNKLLQATHDFLFEMVNTFSHTKLNGVSFKDNFCEFYKQTQLPLQNGAKVDLSANHFKDFKMAVAFVSDHLITLDLDNNKNIDKNIDLFKNLSAPAYNKINAIFSHKKEKQFKSSGKMVRYLGTLDSEKLEQSASSYHSYWHKQAASLQEKL
jgi:subtilisin family serine protease